MSGKALIIAKQPCSGRAVVLIWEGGSFFRASASDFHSVVIMRLGGSAVWRGKVDFWLEGLFWVIFASGEAALAKLDKS